MIMGGSRHARLTLRPRDGKHFRAFPAEHTVIVKLPTGLILMSSEGMTNAPTFGESVMAMSPGLHYLLLIQADIIMLAHFLAGNYTRLEDLEGDIRIQGNRPSVLKFMTRKQTRGLLDLKYLKD